MFTGHWQWTLRTLAAAATDDDDDDDMT